MRITGISVGDFDLASTFSWLELLDTAENKNKNASYSE